MASFRRIGLGCLVGAVLFAALGSCRRERDAGSPGEPRSSYAGSGNLLAYCCVHEAARPSAAAEAPYAHCEQQQPSCKSEVGDHQSTKPVPFDPKWTAEIRRVRRVPSWCCYSWTVPLHEERQGGGAER